MLEREGFFRLFLRERKDKAFRWFKKRMSEATSFPIFSFLPFSKTAEERPPQNNKSSGKTREEEEEDSRPTFQRWWSICLSPLPPVSPTFLGERKIIVIFLFPRSFKNLGGLRGMLGPGCHQFRGPAPSLESARVLSLGSDRLRLMPSLDSDQHSFPSKKPSTLLLSHIFRRKRRRRRKCIFFFSARF